MGEVSSFISGPLSTGATFLLAFINNNFYVLRPDPNPNFIPYFGVVNSSNNGNYQSLSLTVNATNPPTYSILAGSQGFTQTDADGLIMLVPGSGDFNYKFVIQIPAISPGTPIVPNLAINMIVNSLTLNFPYKTPTQEQNDVTNANEPTYLPTYSGTTSDVYIVPSITYPIGICTANTNGAYVDLVSNTQTYPNYFTQAEWCQAQIIVPLNAPFCLGTDQCGTLTASQGASGASGPCFGPCSTNVCGPSSLSPGATLTCSGITPGFDLSSTTIILIVGIILLLVIGGLVYALT